MMMNSRLAAAFLGASLSVLASAASSQAAEAAVAAPPAAVASEGEVLGEVVVTARRRSESLQEVPLTVNAVTADTLQKLNIKNFSDVSSIVPGLNLNTDPLSASSAASMRGVTFSVSTAAEPTVALYMNDVPVQASFLFHTMFDVGQVEALKGPQGTTRGISAPSGAITFTMRKPDLSDSGGYVDANVSDPAGYNLQGAYNFPVIPDVLSVRLAGMVDQNRGDDVKSLFSTAEPSSHTGAERVSIRFEPNDFFNGLITYQHLDQNTLHFQQVSGPGPTNPFFTGVTNPPLSPTSRRSLEELPDTNHIRNDIVVAQVDSRMFGQHFSYVGSYMNEHIKTLGGSLHDLGNVLPGLDFKNFSSQDYSATTQEIRVASDPAPGRFLDYTLGAFYRYVPVGGTFSTTGTLTSGAFGPRTSNFLAGFGAPATAPPTIAGFNPAFALISDLQFPGTIQETSLFGSVTFHLDSNTELTAGLRHIWSLYNTNTPITTRNTPVDINGFRAPCSALGFQPITGSTLCTIPGGLISHVAIRATESPNIYNVALSHHFTRDFLVYVNTGTAYRPPAQTIGLQPPITSNSNYSTLLVHPSERSISYEAGFKSTWFDGRGRLNMAFYRQTFTNLTVQGGRVPYATAGSRGSTSIKDFAFTSSVSALVQGVDLDAAFQISHDWTVSAQGSYSDGKIQNSLVPCAGATPLNLTTNLVNFCQGGAASRLPLWNASMQSEYTHQVTENLDGFIRGLLTYTPKNDRVEAGSAFVAQAYTLVNLYMGIRSPAAGWEASLYAKNAFNTKEATDIVPIDENLSGVLTNFYPQLVHTAGYNQTTMTPPREVGINVHYAFGSR